MSDGEFYNNAIYWVEVEKISPNPYQPRKEFDPVKLAELADSIRQYGILQPLVVTRKEEETEGQGLVVSYELIAGERRLRASKIAGLTQVPVLIRGKDESDKMKLELAIVENLQREDLNPIDRAKALDRLITDFHFKHADIGKKIGKSRVYVSNSIRLLGMPQDMQDALAAGKISEGHTRPILMLSDRPQEQSTLFREITLKKLTVREAEEIARRIATDRVRKPKDLTPELMELERELTETLGTRVQLERRENGGRVLIEFFSGDDLRHLLDLIAKNGQSPQAAVVAAALTPSGRNSEASQEASADVPLDAQAQSEDVRLLDDRTKEEKKEKEQEDEELYSLKHFSI